MKKRVYLRIVAASLLLAVVLSLFSLLGMSRIADIGASQHRGEFLTFLSESVERRIARLNLEQIRNEPRLLEGRGFPFGGGPGGPPPGAGPGGPPPGAGPGGPGGPPPGEDFGRPPMPPPPDADFERDRPRRNGPPRGPKFEFWLVNEAGEVLARKGELETYDFDWSRFDKPKVSGEIKASEDFFRILPGYYVVKLNYSSPLYLISRENRRPFMGPLLLTQAIVTFATVIAALFLSISITFLYLRRKSLEARAVLLRLERGDLKARFEIQKFDEFGSLLLDFNRMAEEIERLVSRVHSAEAARKHLLQELGHDLRTPLTSLTTSFEAFRMHVLKMSEEQRADVGEMIEAEIAYLKELIEKLIEIAQLDEPHYKRSTETIDLNELLSYELRTRQNSMPNLRWVLNESATPPMVIGDGHLVLRLFKNALDNSSRFAKSEVGVAVEKVGEREVLVRVYDDGPGLSPQELESFAKRREQRARREGTKLNFSLGLGSVIMKTIADFHEGQIEIRNRVDASGAVLGAELIVRLPILG